MFSIIQVIEWTFGRKKKLDKTTIYVSQTYVSFRRIRDKTVKKPVFSHLPTFPVIYWRLIT